MKTINEITLYDLMSEDFNIWVSKNKSFGFDVEIESNKGNVVLEEKGIHPCAMESYAELCRAFLKFYDKACQDV